VSENIFTKYYNERGEQVDKSSPDVLFWIQTEIDCDLVRGTFYNSYLWSVIKVAKGAGWRPIERQFGEFREWQPAQEFINQIISKGKARGTK
jgi:hypothetical protein